EVRLVHQRGGLEGLVGALSPQMMRGHFPELVVDDRKQLVRRGLARPHLPQDRRHIGGNQSNLATPYLQPDVARRRPDVVTTAPVRLRHTSLSRTVAPSWRAMPGAAGGRGGTVPARRFSKIASCELSRSCALLRLFGRRDRTALPRRPQEVYQCPLVREAVRRDSSAVRSPAASGWRCLPVRRVRRDPRPSSSHRTSSAPSLALPYPRTC